ncbi:MAG: frataxin domain-containing protein [Alphaproteobacteria bacterium]
MPKERSPFGTFIDETLGYIHAKTEAALGPTVTIERTEDTLILEFESGQQLFFNNLEIREAIGFASPLSGRRLFYYDRDKDSWLSMRDGADLYELLREEFATLSGTPIVFD